MHKIETMFKNFLKTTFRSLFKNRSYSFLNIFGLAVGIACAGLIQKRIKEIGIRKVLGSSVAGILVLFIKEFVWLMLIGSIIACPFAYLFILNWLDNYAYRIDITALPFLVSISCLGLIAVALICVQTIKAAIANPVKSLRTE